MISDSLEQHADQAKTKAFALAADDLRAVAELLDDDHPHDVALERLNLRRPKFREFSIDDRDLPNEFDTNAEVGDVPTPLRRLLTLAGTDIAFLKGVWPDDGHRDSVIEECNTRLAELFENAWSQSPLTVRLKAELNLLKVQVRVVVDGRSYFSAFGERSDGLKAFVALVGFLRTLDDPVPPILLIDEAETHLHLDAQADLVQILQDEVRATQVFYTTHSPGCLPADLGRGLRFVEPTKDHYYSEISHNFWDSRYPGFSSVLFKMGAAAFAFSALRNAVLGEGPGDMILLPTLIRTAIDQETLPYQIAPRLTDFDEDDFPRHDVAANVTYLVDGDQGGRDKKKLLKKRDDVPTELIVEHPTGYAAEDYVEPSLLLSVVSDLRTDEMQQSKPLTLAALPAGETIAQRIDRWFEANGIRQPGKVAVATRLVNLEGPLTLKSGAKTRLVRLDAELRAALQRRTEISRN